MLGPDRLWNCLVLGPNILWNCSVLGPNSLWNCSVLGPDSDWNCSVLRRDRAWTCSLLGPDSDSKHPRLNGFRFQRRKGGARCRHYMVLYGPVGGPNKHYLVSEPEMQMKPGLSEAL